MFVGVCLYAYAHILVCFLLTYSFSFFFLFSFTFFSHLRFDLRDHNENKAFLPVLFYPAIADAIHICLQYFSTLMF